VHLGFDLAVTQHVPIKASQHGVVVHASYMGIYGNCVIIDHGLGVQTLYGHLSSIGVKVGDKVEKGQQIGVSGQTGLAAGDHLYFPVLISGTQVNWSVVGREVDERSRLPQDHDRRHALPWRHNCLFGGVDAGARAIFAAGSLIARRRQHDDNDTATEAEPAPAPWRGPPAAWPQQSALQTGPVTGKVMFIDRAEAHTDLRAPIPTARELIRAWRRRTRSWARAAKSRTCSCT
jgi:murein DD-endopeptidase MepM/ murein hydrolase activator NlpD